MPDVNGSYYADASTAMSLATITAAMATAEDTRFTAVDAVTALTPRALSDHTSAPTTEGLVVTNTTTDFAYMRLNGAWAQVAVNLPYVEYRLNSGQSIGNGSETTVDLDASPVVARGTWSESTGVVTMPIAGFVLVTMGGTFASGGSPSLYQLRLFKNGTTDNVLSVYQAPAVSRVLNGCGIVRVAASDTLRVRAFQNSGGPINLTETNAQVPLLSMQYVMAV